MTQTEILTQLIAYIEAGTELFAPIRFARLEDSGISAVLTGGSCERYLGGGRLEELPVLLLAKSSVQSEAMEALFSIENLLLAGTPPCLCSAEITSSPSLVDSGEGGFIYEMQLTAKAFAAAQ